MAMQETDGSAEMGRALSALSARLRRAIEAAVGRLRRLDRELRGADRLSRLDDRMLRDVGLERVALEPAAPKRDQAPQSPGAPARRSLIRPRR